MPPESGSREQRFGLAGSSWGAARLVQDLERRPMGSTENKERVMGNGVRFMGRSLV